jgi:hypothetical protein
MSPRVQIPVGLEHYTFVTLCDFELSDLDLQFVNKIVVCVLVSINLPT